MTPIARGGDLQDPADRLDPGAVIETFRRDWLIRLGSNNWVVLAHNKAIATLLIAIAVW